MNYPRILGQCKECGALFDICRNGFTCTACGNVGIKGARAEFPQDTIPTTYHCDICGGGPEQCRHFATELSPYQHELNGQGTDCTEDCPACRWSCDKQLAQMEAEPDVTWLEKLYCLEDNR